MTIQDREFAYEYGLPRLGDFGVLKLKAGSEWPGMATAGLFHERWQLPWNQTHSSGIASTSAPAANP